MKKLSVIFMFIAVSAFVFVGCKKYEEGPAFSLASKKGRVVNVWKVEKEIYDGVEQTLDPNDDTSIEFKKDDTFTVSGTSQGVTISLSGTWKFGDKKETIITTMGSDLDTTVIIRLKSKELWVKSTDGKSEYHYVKK